MITETIAFNHTPAPWSVGKNYHDEGNNRIDIRYPHNEWGDTALVAMIRTTNSERAQCDAKLVAAAPEMFKALVKVRYLMLSAGITYENADAYNALDKVIKSILA